MTFSQLQVEIHNNTIGGPLLPSHDQAYPTCGVSLNKSLPDCTSSHDNSVWDISWRIRKPIISEFISTLTVSPTRKGRFRISKKCAKPQGSQQWARPAGKGRIASSSDHKHHPQLHPNKQKTVQKYHRRPPPHEDVANGPKMPLTGEGQFMGYYMIIFWRWCESAPSKQKKDSLFYQVSSWEQSREGDGGRLSIVGSPRKNILYFNNNRKSPQVSPTIIRKCPSGSPLRSFPLPPPSYRRMSIANCPVLHPTWKEFKNFSQYVEKLDRLYKKNYGMVKVVPPPEWKPTSAAYHTKLHGLIVNGPIEQNIFGKGGVYQCLHIQKKSLSLKEYKEKMGVFDRITDDLSADQVEEMFWKNIVFSPPLYGADLLSTLMDQSAGPWNLSGLDSILRYAVNSNVRGVTTPYCYVGSWKTLFCWHKEDLDLSAINFLHEGKSKFWYSIPLDQSHILEREAKTFFPEHFSKCSQHLRHKTTLFNPYNLVKKYPNLKITKTEHRPGQFMLVFGGSYHCGFNFGFNIAEAVNYATLGWLPQLMNCKYCHCTKSSVRASFREILDNLTQSPFAHAREVAELRRVVEMSQEKEMEEEAKVDEIKGIRQQFSRKAKKEKKISKINYRGEEYHIDHWATCDKCGQWRKLQKKLRDGKPFRCDDLGKKCSLRDKVDKDYITL